ncbi:hypothetical protein Pcinc_034965 [Petrolisthes cinctipes]|uniref:Uncharacterized protein n=1 Tax=Petrolisthes cinctipes TaxID=88211 RepID=A0AAE1ENR3_PETCI|nr:hypothetical protein Pcinc_034965 [Petrolisthes cinctipes]
MAASRAARGMAASRAARGMAASRAARGMAASRAARGRTASRVTCYIVGDAALITLKDIGSRMYRWLAGCLGWNGTQCVKDKFETDIGGDAVQMVLKIFPNTRWLSWLGWNKQGLERLYWCHLNRALLGTALFCTTGITSAWIRFS